MSLPNISKASIMASLVGAGYLFYLKRVNQQRKREDEAIRKQSVEEIIREIYMRVSTKENMSVVYNMCSLECEQKEELLQPYDYTLKTGGKRIRLIMGKFYLIQL